MRKIIGLDTETYQENKVMKPFLIQVYSEDFQQPLAEIFEVYREEEMMRFCKFLISKKLRSSVIATYNLAFDISTIYYVLKDPRLKIKLIAHTGRTIGAKITHNKHLVTIIDLRNIIPSKSLNELAKTVGLSKTEKPLFLGTERMKKLYETNEEYRRRVREYALNDAKITYHVAKKYYEIINELIESKKVKFTSGAYAVQIFKSRHADFDFPQYPNELEAKFKCAYRGGRTEVIKRGVNDKPLNYYDINSLYPYVMYSYPYPYNYNNGNGRFVKKADVNLDYLGIAKALIKVEHYLPPLGVKRVTADKYERLIFVEGKIVDYFTYPELLYMEENGYGKIERVEETYEWKIWVYPFREYVTELYELRKKNAEDAFKNRIFKILMNSLYGKFGEYKNSEILLLTSDGIKKITSEEISKFRKYHNVVWAAFVTAYGRLELHKRMKAAGFENVYYCDTDSIITSSVLDVGKELGQLKLEGTAPPGRAVFIRSKFYVFDNVVKFRGFTVSTTYDELKELIKNNKLYIEQLRISKPLESLRRRIPLLSVELYKKFFNIDPDYKRIYLKELRGIELFEDMTDSEAISISEGGIYAFT